MILILGIGNVLLSDEGSGVHALNYLRNVLAVSGVEYLDGGTLSFTLAASVADSEALLVLDAAQLQQPPGCVACFEGEAMDRFLGSAKSSVHEVSLSDLLDMARLSGDLPERRALIAIQPESLDWGELPTASVASAFPKVAELAFELLQKWRRPNATSRVVELPLEAH